MNLTNEITKALNLNYKNRKVAGYCEESLNLEAIKYKDIEFDFSITWKIKYNGWDFGIGKSVLVDKKNNPELTVWKDQILIDPKEFSYDINKILEVL